MEAEPTESNLVHVLIPAYGRSSMLTDTLASTATLAAYGWTVTVVDDATPDSSIEETVSAFGHVRYVRNQERLGVAGNFNRCAELSEGRYTVMLGSDDMLMPTYPGIITSLIDRFGGPDLAHPGVEIVDEYGQPALPLADRVKGWLTPYAPVSGRLFSGDRLASSLLLGDWLYFPAIAWKTSTLRSFPFETKFTSAMDLDVLLRIVFAGGTLAYDPAVGMLYRRHVGSVSSGAAHEGARFDEEESISRAAKIRAQELGWKKSATAASVMPTVRAHKALQGVSRLLKR